MRFLIICSIVLLSSCTTLTPTKSNYIVELAPRGLSSNHNNGNHVLEVRLCDGDYCLFVEPRELRLLGIDLGETTDEIFTTVSNMDDFDRTWLFKDLEHIYLIGL